jgi:uncharacterized protein (TIGR00369 family)
MSESHVSPASSYVAMAERFASVVPHVAAMGIEVVTASIAKATLKLPWQAKLVGNHDEGFLHGGAITTLIDSASGLAVFLALEKPPSIATLDLRINYLRPPSQREAVIAEAECYRLTRNIAFVRAFAHHGDLEKPIANSSSTFMLGSPGRPLARGREGDAS